MAVVHLLTLALLPGVIVQISCDPEFVHRSRSHSSASTAPRCKHVHVTRGSKMPHHKTTPRRDGQVEAIAELGSGDRNPTDDLRTGAPPADGIVKESQLQTGEETPMLPQRQIGGRYHSVQATPPTAARSASTKHIESWDEWQVLPSPEGSKHNTNHTQSVLYMAEEASKVPGDEDWLLPLSGDGAIPGLGGEEASTVSLTKDDEPDIQVKPISVTVNRLIPGPVGTQDSPAAGQSTGSLATGKSATPNPLHTKLHSGRKQFGPSSLQKSPVCASGWGLCVESPVPSGTVLLWRDLQRTLSFSWGLHVYGTATLSLLLAVGACVGLLSLCHPSSSCCWLALVNSLLLVAAALWSVHFLLDPYGSNSLLPRPVLLTLCNLPLPLLLWGQASIVMLAVDRVGVTVVPTSLHQRPLLVGGLALLHCSMLIWVHLMSTALPRSVPVLLQTLSLAWGLGLSLGFLVYTLPHLQPSLRAREPGLGRTLAVCALLGMICCMLQVYATLWLYGLLGDWRRFGWDWWVVQCWARLLELTWAWTLLHLSCRVTCRSWASAEHQGNIENGSESHHQEALLSYWASLIERLPSRKQENAWAELLPNNWAGHLDCQRQEQIRASVMSSTFGDGLKDSSSGPMVENFDLITEKVCEEQTSPQVDQSMGVIHNPFLQNLLQNHNPLWSLFLPPVSPSTALPQSGSLHDDGGEKEDVGPQPGPLTDNDEITMM